MKTTKSLFAVIFSLLFTMILVGCGAQAATEAPAPLATELSPTEAIQPAPPTEPPAQPSTAASGEASAVSFANDILPIIESRCVSCHGGERTQAGLRMRSYDELMAGSDNGAVILPGDAANSLLVELVSNQKMPKRGPKLTPPQMQLITDWVNSGAPNN